MNKNSVDELLLQSYKMGWDECFYGDKSNGLILEEGSLLRRAYFLGWSDYIIGDDVSSVDAQTDDEIIKHIKND
jgi:hypothetical protein